MSVTAINSNAIPQLGVSARGNRFMLVVGGLVASALVGSTLAAHGHVGAMGPVVKPFLPICATIWCFAELLTAFLMLSQFYVGGKIGFAVIAFGYGFTGLLAVPYLLFFPGVFGGGPYSTGDLQVSAALWTVWHLAFPASMAAAHIADGSLDKVGVPRSSVASTLVATIASIVALTAVVSLAIYFGRGWLPIGVLANGHFSHLWRVVVQPIVVGVNAVSLLVVLVRARRMSPLQMWIAIAILTMLLDALINCWAPARYSIVWYVGKVEAFLTSVTVLVMLLAEVATLYRRLYDVASVDTLTGLPNRRSFNDLVARTLDGREHRASGIAMAVIDIDYFKLYNDRYGHAAGDIALASVADALRGSLLRKDDFAGRFGGEEFVLLLPDVMMNEAEEIAERALRRVSRLAIAHEDSATKWLTVSVGVAFCPRYKDTTAAALFDCADRALYAAKSAGRNNVHFRILGEAERDRYALTSIRAGV